MSFFEVTTNPSKCCNKIFDKILGGLLSKIILPRIFLLFENKSPFLSNIFSLEILIFEVLNLLLQKFNHLCLLITQ